MQNRYPVLEFVTEIFACKYSSGDLFCYVMFDSLNLSLSNRTVLTV